MQERASPRAAGEADAVPAARVRPADRRAATARPPPTRRNSRRLVCVGTEPTSLRAEDVRPDDQRNAPTGGLSSADLTGSGGLAADGVLPAAAGPRIRYRSPPRT